MATVPPDRSPKTGGRRALTEGNQQGHDQQERVAEDHQSVVPRHEQCPHAPSDEDTEDEQGRKPQRGKQEWDVDEPEQELRYCICRYAQELPVLRQGILS
jgi:hypothetical protein